MTQKYLISLYRNHQNYIMVLPFRNVPTHTQAIAIPQGPFTYTLRPHHLSHAPHLSHIPQFQHVPLGATGAIAPSAQPAIAYTHSGPAEENAVLHAPEPSAVPTPPATVQYRLQPSALGGYPGAHPLQYASQQLQIQPSLAYELPQQQSIVYHHPKPLVQQQFVPAQIHNHHHPFTSATNLDFFNPYGKQPNSLLESYVPSSVILQRQRALQQARQLYHPSIGSNSPSIYGNHQPGYNTIAYSTYQGYTYAKRSPKAVTANNIKPNIGDSSSNNNLSASSSNTNDVIAKKN